MSAPFVCPACGAESAAAPCPHCGHSLPAADASRTAIPVPPPPERRRRRPIPPLVTEAQAATGVRWAIIIYGFMVLGMCLLAGLLTGK